MKTGKQRLGRRLLALLLAMAALLTVLPGALAADGKQDDIALATQWSFPAGWHYSADDHSFTHDPEGGAA